MLNYFILTLALTCFVYGETSTDDPSLARDHRTRSRADSIEREVCNDDPNSFFGCMDLNRHCNIDGHIVNEDYRCITHGCQCKDNYVYDDNQRKCVIPQECTPCNDDPNAYFGCAALNEHCNGKVNPTTEDYRCPVPGCQCLSDYLFDDKLNKCVPAEECTK